MSCPRQGTPQPARALPGPSTRDTAAFPLPALVLMLRLNKTLQTNCLFKYINHFSVRIRACFLFAQQWPCPALTNAPSLIPGVCLIRDGGSRPWAPPWPGHGRPPLATAHPPPRGLAAATPDPPGCGETRKTGNHRVRNGGDSSAGSPRCPPSFTDSGLGTCCQRGSCPAGHCLRCGAVSR